MQKFISTIKSSLNLFSPFSPFSFSSIKKKNFFLSITLVLGVIKMNTNVNQKKKKKKSTDVNV